jgi:hypothetical protein
MKLEYSILEHLSENDDGKFVDITYIAEDYFALKNAVEELKGKNLILVDVSGRDFEAFGIGNNREKSIKAKIKMNGRVYFDSLKKIKKMGSVGNDRKSRWSLSYFFNF